MKTIVNLVICTIFLSSCANDPTPPVDWKKIDLKTTTDLQTVFFVNSSVGFVGGTQRAKLSVFTYKNIVEGYFEYIESVHINTDSTKYLYKTFSADNPEPTLFVTRDGGNSWTSLATPFVSSITDIFFLDELVGYVATEYEGVHKTTDGGKTWKSVLSNLGFLGHQRVVENPFDKVYFLNTMEGFAFKQYNNVVVKTIDGGASWAVVSSFDLRYEGGGLKSMTFPSDNFTGYGVGSHYLAKTVNGGLTWDTLQFKLLPASLNDGFLHDIQDLSFLDENVAFMIYGGVAYISRDGAFTWERIDRPFGDRIQPINENEFYVLSDGNPTIAFGDVSGEKYTWMTLDHGKAQLNDWFFTDGKGFAVGPNGLLLKYEMN